MYNPWISYAKVLDPIASALAMYASTFTNGRGDSAKGLDTLELANQLLPSNLEIKMQLAGVYVDLNCGSDARPLLRSVIAWSHGGDTSAAERTLAAIDGISGAAADQAGGGRSPGPGPWAPSPAP